MKTNKFFKNSSMAIAAFLLTGVSIVAMYSFVGYTDNNDKCHAQTANNTVVSTTATSMSSDTDMIQLKEINEELGKLVQKRTELTNKLEKVKAHRNKNYGMVAGMYYQPSQALAEIVNLEGKIDKLGHKIAALTKKEQNLAKKCSNTDQKLAIK